METPLAACLDLPGNGARKRAVDVGVENLCGVTFLHSPATTPEKELDTRTARVRWEPQEEGVMRTAASFPSVRNQGLSNQ